LPHCWVEGRTCDSRIKEVFTIKKKKKLRKIKELKLKEKVKKLKCKFI
jgi:hypothetical protein